MSSITTVPFYDLEPHKPFAIYRIEEHHSVDYFAAHRHTFYEIIWISEGDGTHSIDFVEHPIRCDHVYFIAPGQVHQWHGPGYHGQYKGVVLTFGAEFIYQGQPQNHRAPLNHLFRNCDATPFIRLTRSAHAPFARLIALMEEEYGKRDADSDILRALLTTFLLYAARIKTSGRRQTGVRIQERVAQVQDLIEQHYRQERSAEFYARRLHLTPKRLNEILRQTLGKTVTQLLHDRLLLEAKRELAFSSRSIKEIAHTLGFEDTSYFSRFFRRHAGLSPRTFRENTFK